MSSSAHKNDPVLDRLADEFGVAVVVLDEKNAEVAVSNNNSICRTMTASAVFALRCAEFCGRAFELTHRSGEAVDYECHAGLSCRAVPTDDEEGRKVTIVGRTFVKSDGYRKATEKAISGEWSIFSPADLFENVLMTGSAEPINQVADQLRRTTPAKPEPILDLGTETFAEQSKQADVIAKRAAEINDSLVSVEASVPIVRGSEEATSASSLRSLSNSLMDADYREACTLVLKHIQDQCGIGSLVWLEQYNDGFRSVAATGEFAARPVNVKMRRDAVRLLQAADRGDAVELKERAADGRPASRLMLFPVRVGNEVRAAVGVRSDDTNLHALATVGRLARSIGPQIEIWAPATRSQGC